jgi:putative membrane protein
MESSAIWTVAQRGGAYGPMGEHMSGWAWGWMWVGGSVLLIVLLALVALAVVAVVRSSRPPDPSSQTSRPQRILDERYARGELSTEEYRERQQALNASE